MKFGGWTQFGGAAQFGSGESRALHYYRALKSIALPGLWSQDDAALINQFLRTDAVGLALGQVLADRLDVEAFPHEASETLIDWERVLGLATDADLAIATRRAAVLGIWQGAKPASLPALRQLLAPILNPTRLFVDDFEDDDISWRYEQHGIGNSSEASGTLTFGIHSTSDGRWEDAAQTPVLYLVDLVDQSDDVEVNTLVSAIYDAAQSASGVTLYQDHQNAVMAAYENGNLRLDKIVDGVLTEGTAVAAPALPFWVQISKEGLNWTMRYGSNLDVLTDVESTTAPFLPKKGGLFSRNPGVGTGVTMDVEDLEIAHARPENNVEIIEQTLANLALGGGDDDDIFFAFVHRNPGDAGEYDIGLAQRLLDRVAQAHTVILVGESDSFLCDDDESLCNRDVLGRW